jgi:hypothetical protein
MDHNFFGTGFAARFVLTIPPFALMIKFLSPNHKKDYGKGRQPPGIISGRRGFAILSCKAFYEGTILNAQR